MKLLARNSLFDLVEARFRANPVVMLLGPRQCGKTTLARRFAAIHKAEYFDLEAPGDQNRLAQPGLALSELRGYVVIDEAQLQPNIFPLLRVLSDRRPRRCRFLLLGSASPELAQQVSESLAGRVALLSMSGFTLGEVGVEKARRLWWRGGFPRAFLARSESESAQWRHDFIATFLERDLRRLGVQVAPLQLRRFWNMVAHSHGQLWNASDIGRSLGEAHTTVKRHLDILTGALVTRQLPPWFENLGKRQVKSPKVYVRDSGLLHALLGFDRFSALESHPKLGASWEGFAIEQLLSAAGERDAYFWNTQGGAELDLLLLRGGKRYGFEFKYADAPKLTKSMHIAREDLRLHRLFVVHPGEDAYPLAPWAEAAGLGQLCEAMSALGPRRRS